MASKIKVYTKGGDKGETSLIGGTRVPKFHPRIEAYGTLDELNSFIGLISDQEIDKYYKNILVHIQEKIFSLESLLAIDPGTEIEFSLPTISADDIKFLETEIDKMNEGLPELKSFVLPGGHPTVSYCHIARTICRRAERIIIRLSHASEVDPLIIQYLNRLSDYLFVLARKMALLNKIEERLWNPST